jgi:hypothetical protein
MMAPTKHDDDDDREYGSLLASPYFWVGVLIGLGIWGVVLWAAFA